MTAVSEAMRAEIISRLASIAEEENVRILFAIESGSRAWGFHSPDSDYDVRFVYARPRDWHYRLGKKRDVIERPISDELDISGWELSKALTLALGSNAVLAEWLQSPIRYIADDDALERLTRFTERVLTRKSVTWHYLSLARRQLDRLHDGKGRVRTKRYFYVIRPVLAMRWMRLHESAMPPMDMAALRAACDLDAGIASALDELTELKMAAQERASMVAGMPVLDSLIAEEVAIAEDWVSTAPRPAASDHWDAASALHMDLSPQ